MKIFEIPEPSVPIAGSDDTFPVHRIYCVGRNYGAHAKEMGHDPKQTPPVFFMKPADAVVLSGSTVAYPSRTEDLQHEIELVVAIGEPGTGSTPPPRLPPNVWEWLSTCVLVANLCFRCR